MRFHVLARRAATVLAAFALAGIGSAAQAQAPATGAWPQKSITLLLGFPPGGGTDGPSRQIADKLRASLGVPVVVENRPGANQMAAIRALLAAPPDGYTLLVGTGSSLAQNPALNASLGYDPLKDFTPVAWVARVPNVLVVNPSVPAKSLAELLELARKQPGRIAYGSGGNGSAAHTTMEYLKLVTKTSFLHIPYRGTAPSVADLLAGQVQVLFTGIPALLPHIKAGKMRALAVSSPKRLKTLPDVPTVAESGIPGTKGFEADQWYGIVAPAGTPPEIVRMLNTHVNKALASPEVATRLAGEGAEPTPETPQAYGALIEAEIKRWAPVIRAGNIKPE